MAKASKVSPTLNSNISHDDDVDDNGDEDNDKESDNIASLKIKGEMIFKSLYKNKLACSNFLEIMSIATEGKKYIDELEAHLEEHEATIETMQGHERDYDNEIAELSQALDNEQTTKESLEETFALELSRLKGSYDRALVGIAYQNLVDIEGQYNIWGSKKHENDSLVHLAEAIINPYNRYMKDSCNKEKCARHSTLMEKLDKSHNVYTAKEAYTSYEMYRRIVDIRKCLLPQNGQGSRW
ncbi:hypothetical protein D1007_39524 [Hordeum vulgare]|nr:hypothetical protein D1007_39524 [Hordeum vulgare]